MHVTPEFRAKHYSEKLEGLHRQTKLCILLNSYSAATMSYAALEYDAGAIIKKRTSLRDARLF
jgi:hypothetical protein